LLRCCWWFSLFFFEFHHGIHEEAHGAAGAMLDFVEVGDGGEDA